jgi:hypothetical protein
VKWFFCSLLLGNLVYIALNLWGEEAGMFSKAELAGDSAFKTSSSGPYGFEKRGSRILLFSEDIQLGDKSTVEVALQPTLVGAANALNTCMGLGPFENVISAQGVAKRLEAIGYHIEMTAVNTFTGESDYRVVMLPLSSRQEAFRRLRELKTRGIDSFAITKGVYAQGISLGVFSSNGSAEDYRQKLIGLGYEVLLDVLPRVSRGYWVQLSSEMFPQELLLDVAAEFIGVEVAETGCMN